MPRIKHALSPALPSPEAAPQQPFQLAVGNPALGPKLVPGRKPQRRKADVSPWRMNIPVGLFLKLAQVKTRHRVNYAGAGGESQEGSGQPVSFVNEA